MSKNGEVDREGTLEGLRDLAIKKVPGDLGESVGRLHRALVDLQAHIKCAQGDLLRLSKDFQAERHCLDCMEKDLTMARAELACIKTTANVIRNALLSLTDTTQIAALIDPILKALS